MQEAAERWGFSPDDVGLVTGNRRVNPDAPILVVVAEILFNRLLRKEQFEFDEVLVLAHQDVIELLLDEEADGLAETEEQIGKSIRLQPESLYLKDQFDVVLI